MDCWHCRRNAVGVCRFCGRAVCENHVKTKPYILELFRSDDVTKALVVEDALFCGACTPRPDPVDVPEVNQSVFPATYGSDAVVVHREVHASEGEVLDALTEFALAHRLEVDRTYSGEGLLFRAAREAPGDAMFRNHDRLVVSFESTPASLEVTFAAEMLGLRERGEAWKRARMMRGLIFSLAFGAAGVAGLARGVNFGDFIPLGISGFSMTRTVRVVQGESESREELERAVANELHRLCDAIDD